MDKRIDPFATETIELRVPITAGERTVKTLTFKVPKLRDLLGMDKYPEGSVAASRALLSALTGEPEIILDDLCPEDWADCLVILSRTYQRFIGLINLFDKEDETADPTMAGQPPKNSEKTSKE